jgi:hypothetical protein
VELPKCNLVVRFDPPSSFKSMVQSRGRAKVNNAYYVTIVDANSVNSYVQQWAEAISLEKVSFNSAFQLNESPTMYDKIVK